MSHAQVSIPADAVWAAISIVLAAAILWICAGAVRPPKD